VLISSLGDGDLVIYDAASRKEFKRVKIGHGAAGILMDRDGNRVFIACGPDNYVAVLDLTCPSARFSWILRDPLLTNQQRSPTVAVLRTH
jgi:DNA-binding beta-propeller fold protein YncE